MENKLLSKRKEIENTIFILFILIFIYIFAFPMLRFIKLKRDIKEIELEISFYKNKIENLNSKIEFYKTDEGVERWIKENFKFIRDGEKIYIFKDKKLTNN